MPKARQGITKRAVDAMQPGETLWDAALPGFCVRCRAGGAKTYGLKYRDGAGRGARQRWFSIGRHGAPWTVEQARDEALRLLNEVARGKDPMGEKSHAGKAPTVGAMLDQWLAEHVEPKRKGRTATEYRRLVELARPSLGAVKVEKVKRSDVAKLHHALRGTPYHANRMLAVLSSAFNWAEKVGLRSEGTNPARRVEKYREQARERFLSDDELIRLGTVLRQAEEGHRALERFTNELAAWKRKHVEGRERATYGAAATRPKKPEVELAASPYAVAAIRLLILTGARLGEVLGLRWEWIDLGAGLIRLPDSKTGKKTVELPPAAVALLSELPRFEGKPFVIAGECEGAALVNLEAPWRRIRKAAMLNDVRLHDLRHTYASKAIGAGYSLRVAGSLLGHTQAATTQRYAHVADTVRRRAAETVAAEIAAALDGTGGGEVVPLKRPGSAVS